MDEIESVIMDVARRFVPREYHRELNSKTHLFEGPLDSLSGLEFFMAIEDACGVSLRGEAIDFRVLDTPSKIAHLIQQLKLK